MIKFQKHAKDMFFSRSYFTDCFQSIRAANVIYGAFVVTLAMLRRVTNCRFINLLLLCVSGSCLCYTVSLAVLLYCGLLCLFPKCHY